VLLDEPLANLDVHLRAAMEREFARFHERTGTTMVYITHDQAEAMALADRIAVMHKGRVLQFATPSQLYREPADATVAAFVGEGMLLPAEVGEAMDGTCTARVFDHVARVRCAPGQPPGAASCCVRAQALRVTSDGGIAARVQNVTYEGGRFRIEAAVDGTTQVLHFVASEPCRLQQGDAVRLAIDDGWIIP